MNSPKQANPTYLVVLFGFCATLASSILALVFSSSSMIMQQKLLNVSLKDSNPLFVADLASFCSKGAKTENGSCSFSITIPSQKQAPDFHFSMFDVLKVNRLDLYTNSIGGAKLLIRSKGSPDETMTTRDYRKVDLVADRQISLVFANGNITFQFDAEKVTTSNQVIPAFDYLRVAGLPQVLSGNPRVDFKMNATTKDVNRPISNILQLIGAVLFSGLCITMMQTYTSIKKNYLNR